MKIKVIIEIALNNLKREKAQVFFSMIGIVIGVAVMFFILSLGNGAKEIIKDSFLLNLPEDYLVVKPKSLDVSVLKIDTKLIYDDDIDYFKTIEGVKDAYSLMYVNFPISFYANLFGEFIGADAPVLGLDERLVEDKKNLDNFKYEEDAEFIPVILSPLLLEYYNTAYAISNRLPGLSEKALIGKSLTLVLGESTIHPREADKYKELKCKIVGLSPQASVLSITIPLEYVREYNEWFNAEKPEYAMVYLETARDSNIVGITKVIEEMGFFVEPYDESINRIHLMVNLTTFLLAGVGVVILFFAALSIFNVVVLKLVQKEKEIRIYRMLGAKRVDIKRVLNFEFLLLSFFGSLLGIVIGFLGMQIMELIFLRYVPDFMFKPEYLFKVGFFTVSLPFLIGIIFGMVGVFIASKKMISAYPIDY